MKIRSLSVRFRTVGLQTPILAGDQHIGDITLDGHLKKVITEESEQGVEVVGVRVVDDKKENHRDKYQHWQADVALALIDQRQQVDQQKTDDLLVHRFYCFDFHWQAFKPMTRG